jgi:tetratricopeptide (TPR) repeat protein
MHMPDSEKADGSLAKAIALAVQEAPAADREQAWREVLAVDPRCGFAHNFLCSVLGVNGRQGEVERAVCELVLQQPRLCSARLTLAGLLRINDDKPGAERELREALQLHRGCPEAVEGLVRLLAPSERWADLTNLLEQAHLVRPHALNTTIFLAGAREQNGDTQGAHDLLHSMDGLPEENEIVDAVLLQTAFAVGELELAGRELLRLGPQAAESERIRDMLGSVKFFNRGDDSSHSNAPVVRPRIFGPGELSAELDRRLTAEERKLVVNPIELTPELTAEARRLTVGFTNDWLRAFALFAEVAQRGRGPGDGGRRTASEALKDSGDPQTRFACQEYAKLFVALARVLGLEAWLVHIELCADGSPAYHDCAALFLEGQGLLIDPTWRVFGISHQVFTVLDDVQTISHQTMQLNGEDKPDPQRLRAGLKLYPEDRWTRLQFVRGMAKAGELDTAAEELRKVQATGAESWDVYEAAAELEMASEHWQPALAELQRALALNPSNHGGALQLCGDLVETIQASIQSADEALFFGTDYFGHKACTLANFWESVAHEFGENRNNLVDDRFLLPEQAGVARRATQDTAQHVASPFVGRKGAVGNSEGEGAEMVGDDAVRHPGHILCVWDPGELRDFGDKWSKYIRIIIGANILQNGADALKAHARINMLIFERKQFARANAFKLHEHIVPDFDVAVVGSVYALLGVGEGARLRSQIALVKMNFGTRTARAGIAHFPEVGLSAKAHDAVLGKSRNAGPDLRRFVIVLIDRHKETVHRKLPNLGQKLPSPGNCLFLVIVSKGPIAEHFKKGVMVCVAAHFIQIIVFSRNANALLGIGHALIGFGIVAQEAGFELVHSRIDEHQGRIILRNHRRGPHKEVALAFKELDEGIANFDGSPGDLMGILAHSGANLENIRQ